MVSLVKWNYCNNLPSPWY